VEVEEEVLLLLLLLLLLLSVRAAGVLGGRIIA
jgi:hypothetical protein